jgi:glycosyltransferase involved in cell wall biosynthesis
MSTHPNPLWSALCLTYTRTKKLEHALSCFLSQTRLEDGEMVIVNTCPQQTLVFEHPRVTIVNCTARPATLGEARNISVDHARGKWLLTWDDDDAYLEDHAASFFAHDTGKEHWLWQPWEFYALESTARGIMSGSYNVMAIQRDTLLKLGGYTRMNFGEDGDLVVRIRNAKIPGESYAGHKRQATFIHCYTNKGWQITNWQHDTKDSVGYDIVGQLMSERIKAGKIPSGRIELQPSPPKVILYTAKKMSRATPL